MRYRHRSDEKHVESRERAVRDAEAAKSRFVAGVTVPPESELVFEYGGEGEVFPIEGPIPIAGITVSG